MNYPWAIRGVLFGVLALVLVACGSPRPTEISYNGPNGEAQPRNTNDVCDIFAQYPHWRTAAEASSRRWGTPVEVKMAIMWRESHFRATASPGTSSAYGYAQALNGTWDWYRESTGRKAARRDNFADASDFVGWYMDRTRKANGLSFHDPYRQYLAYHEGHTGYKRGSYAAKPRLLSAAQEVQTMAAKFRGQLGRC